MYIFGYGSLINSSSRQLTGQTGRAIPAIAHGLIRHWGKVDESYILSPLVASQGEGQVNGLLLEIDDAALAEFDQRERGYCRVELSASQIETEYDFNRQHSIWVYVREQPQSPCHDSPIMQSYLDTVLVGCLEISDHFAMHFIEHTQGWHSPLENDRHQPKYNNMAGVATHHHSIIDDLIATVRTSQPVKIN